MQITIRQGPTFNNAYWRSFLEIQSKYADRGRFLEIGAADKKRTKALAAKYKNLVGLDLDFAKLSQIEQVKLCNADACRLPFKDKVFDGVIAHHVIEHIQDDALFLGELRRVLKDGAFAILGTPNRNRLVSLARSFFFGKRKFPWREHVREYDKEMLSALLGKVMFSKSKISGKFIGVHSSGLVVGFDNCPGILERFCNFWFIELSK